MTLDTAQTTKTWKFEVVDFKALPDEYKQVDAAKLGKVVRAGLHTIAGVRIYEEESLPDALQFCLTVTRMKLLQEANTRRRRRVNDANKDLLTP